MLVVTIRMQFLQKIILTFILKNYNFEVKFHYNIEVVEFNKVTIIEVRIHDDVMKYLTKVMYVNKFG